ncbi:MAG TPA: aspartate ammonia-lyase [Thermomicrobiales bacterium]|nr:aspartate ammonia-lyase [Thermomicrobiales bacterium]
MQTHESIARMFAALPQTRGYDTSQMRIEHDSLGEVEIPASAYWGVHTARALQNFPISGKPISIYPDLIAAYAAVKQAAARANAEIGALSQEHADLIDAAAEEVRNGALREEFVVDILQGGAGTSTNMNVNEVLANRALEIGGYVKGDYHHLHPLDDVNRSQSTNDTYPTAFKIGLQIALRRLIDELQLLEEAFAAKGREFAGILKVGRTQLQDAVPMTLGQEFSSFATTLEEDHSDLEAIFPYLREINLGATAIGTGIASDPTYAEAARRHLSEIVGFELITARNLVAATSDVGVFLKLSGVLKTSAMKLAKIANDLRLLASGPQAGLGEIHLPSVQAGSSIMPGKVNPVIPESVDQVAFTVAGADQVVTMAAQAGQLQLNAFLPVVAHSLFQSLQWMTAVMGNLRERCVVGIEANTDRLQQMVSTSVGVVTALVPIIGYEEAAEIAKRGLATGESIADMVVERGLMSRADVESHLTPARLARETPVESEV